MSDAVPMTITALAPWFGGKRTFDIEDAIAAALRRAANEAAWRGHDIASQYGIMSNRPASEIVASEYGPRPEGGTR